MFSSATDQDAIQQKVLKEHQENPHPNLSGDRLRLHVALHTVVETQVAEGNPPAAAQTLERLVGEGLDRHEAIHAMAAVVSDEMYNVAAKGAQYDEERYVKMLNEIETRNWE